MNLKITRRLATVAMLATLAACSSTPDEITDRSLKSIPVGFVPDETLTIVAADGSFTLKGGEQFSSPFQANAWSPMSAALNPGQIVEGFDFARKAGARNVKVFVKGRDKPLYGVLLLSQVYNSAEGPGARSYQITIPADKIAAAYGGRTAVAYEDVQYTRRWDNGMTRKNQWRSWALWLSMTPL